VGPARRPNKNHLGFRVLEVLGFRVRVVNMLQDNIDMTVWVQRPGETGLGFRVLEV
jgi:hypothetical protein